MKRRAKVEKGVSPYYEAIWHRRRRLVIPGQGHCKYMKQDEGDYCWAHPQIVVETVQERKISVRRWNCHNVRLGGREACKSRLTQTVHVGTGTNTSGYPH